MPAPAAPRRPTSPGHERASPSRATGGLGCTPDFRGLRSLLGEASLSDLELVVEGECGAQERIPVHRAVLAGVSQVLRAKFAGGFSDASADEWRPEVGSAAAWHWTLRWIYGHEEPLPAALLVEVLLLADHFQIESLAAGIQAFPLEDVAVEVVKHILQACVCPEMLAMLARRCVPLVVHSADVWQQMWSAAPPNAALFARFLPVLCEMDRLRVLAEYMERHRAAVCCKEDFETSEEADLLPNCLLGAVGWQSFPAEALEAACHDDVAGLSALCGLKLRPSRLVREAMQRALARRCQALEFLLHGGSSVGGRQSFSGLGASVVASERAELYLLPLGQDILSPPTLGTGHPHGLHSGLVGGGVCGVASPVQGLFGRLVSLGFVAEVHMSSVHCKTPRDRSRLFDFHELTQPSTAAWPNASQVLFGTQDVRADRQLEPDEQPWIRIFAKDCEVRPSAVGLKHGWFPDSHFCKAFVVEAMRAAGSTPWGHHGHGEGGGGPEASAAAGATGGGGWVPILEQSAHALSPSGEIFPVEAKSLGGDDTFYDRFRIRMTGPNDHGTWHLMVRWFDIFGQFRAKPAYFAEEGCRTEATL